MLEKLNCYLAKVSVFLIMAALIGGMAGCVSAQYTLSISSTTGGTVTVPGEGSFTYAHDTVVDLMVEAEEGYGLTWTGDVDWIASIHSLSTNITMYDNYSITATFVEIQRIQDWYDLNAIRDNLSGHYALMNDLDSTTPGYEELASPTANGGAGWQPIGTRDYPVDYTFTGTFDGDGYEIRDLFLNRPEEDNVGLFGSIGEGAFISNIGVVNASVLGHEDVGSLVGDNDGTVSNCYATGNISSNYWNVGGLVGSNHEGTVVDSYSNGSVSGLSTVGGLVGLNIDIVRNSHSSASVTGTMVGGLVGVNWYNGTVRNSYSTGNVTGDESVYGYGEYVGGLVAGNNGDITGSYSTGSVTGDRSIGGLVAVNTHTINNSYSTGSVTGDNTVGGLVGWNGEGDVSNSYSTGSVAGNLSVGGLVGWNEDGTVSNSFWDTETSGQATSDGGMGKTTAEMKDIATFSGATWDIIAVANPGTRNHSYIWNIVDDETYPFLSWELEK